MLLESTIARQHYNEFLNRPCHRVTSVYLLEEKLHMFLESHSEPNSLWLGLKPEACVIRGQCLTLRLHIGILLD